MVPYLLSAGVHQRRDLTAAREELAGSHPEVEFRLGQPLGPHRLLDELVMARIDELKRPVCAPAVDSSHEMVRR
jgi:sirohydrochlorin ferrochelatase